jgi:hypothetical protein
MMTYQFQGPAKQCASSGRELVPGEKFVSVLRDVAGQFVRQDYALEAWTEPPADAVAWWAGRIPEGGRPTKPTINDELLLDCFTHLTNTTDPARLNFRYVVALLLMRRKRFKFEDARKQDGKETLLMRDAKSGQRHEVIDPQLNEDEMDVVRDEVFRVLGWDS